MCGTRLRRLVCIFLSVSLLFSSSLCADVILSEEDYQELQMLLDTSEKEIAALEKDLDNARTSLDKQMSLLTQLMDTQSQQDKLLDELETSCHELEIQGIKSKIKTGAWCLGIGIVFGIAVSLYAVYVKN